MNGLEYLATVPAYMINLDRSPERWALAQNRVAPFVRELIRVPGFDARQLSDAEVEEFGEQIANSLILPPSRPEGEKQKGKSWLRGTLGCRYGHIAAMEAGIAGGEGFLVLEDDAAFYRNDLLAATPAPVKPGVYVWGGAMLHGKYIDHQRRYMAWGGEVNNWRYLTPNPFNHGIATAYEFTSSDIAEKWLPHFVAHPHAADVSWWVPMRMIDTWVTEIEVIQQDPLDKSVRATSTLKNKHAGGLFLESILGERP